MEASLLYWVGEIEGGGVQEVVRQVYSGDCRRAAVAGIAEDRAADVGKVQPDLVGATSKRVGFQQAHSVETLADDESCLHQLDDVARVLSLARMCADRLQGIDAKEAVRPAPVS